MASTGKIFGWMALLGGGIFGITKLFRTADTGKKLSFTILNVDKPKINGGALRLSVNVAFDNPTNHTLSMKKPNLKAYFNGKEIGNSIPSLESLQIKANDRTVVKGINIQIPFLKLGGIAVSLIAGKVPKLEFDITAQTIVDNLPYTDKQHFKL